MAQDNLGIQRRQASARGPIVWGVLKGDRLPGAPEANFSGGVQYNAGMVLGGNAYVRLDATYVGPSYIDFMKEGSLKIGDYGTASLRIGYTRDRYELVLFAENLSNNRGITNAAPNFDYTGLTDIAYRIRPRMIGATLRFQY